MTKQYIINRIERCADAAVKPVERVYEFTAHDYGCSNDDTRIRGIPHITLTRNPSGGYPFFTIPLEDVTEV